MSLAANTTATIIPCLRYRDAMHMIDWLCDAFGFQKRRSGSCDPWSKDAAAAATA